MVGILGNTIGRNPRIGWDGHRNEPGAEGHKEEAIAIEGGHIVDIDVDTVIIDGEVLMENRVVKTVNEAEVLETAQEKVEVAIGLRELGSFLEYTEKYWGHSRY
jgi:hypothetical protein